MAGAVATKRTQSGILSKISTVGKQRPTRAVLYAVEGWGKSSIATHFPNPIVLMTKGEDGLLTLIDNGLVPETPHFEQEAEGWNGLIACVRELLVVRDHGFKTLVIDTLNGAQNMLVAHMIQTEYGGTPSKFHDFGRGWKPSRDEWLKFVEVLTRVNASGVSILLLAHADIVKFQNPEGLDYDRYVPRMNKLLWEPVQEWADMVLFGQLETFVKAEPGQQQAKKGKAFGGQERLLYCERTAVADAKNRHNLPGIIQCGQGAESAWNALATAMAEGRKLPPKEPTPESEPDPQ